MIKAIVTIYDDINDWLAEHDKKVRKKTIEEIQDNIEEITWYHIHNGNLAEGANIKKDEPLYKYADIKNMFEQIKEKNDENG